MPQPTTAEAKQEAEWQADSDARTLSEANVILGDKKRLKAAKIAAKKLAKEAKESFEGMLRVANKGEVVEGMKVINKED